MGMNEALNDQSLASRRESNTVEEDLNMTQQKKRRRKKKKSVENTENENLFNQITITEFGMAQKFNLSRCQQKHKSLPPHQICKGKSTVEPSSTNTEQMHVNQAMAIHFQEEIILNILIRLPVRSLLRFKCVSKSWRTLITDPYFKTKHLGFAKNDQTSQKFLVSQKCFGKDDTFSFYCSSLSQAQLVEDVQKLDCPISCRPWACKMYCCSDGLFFLGVYDEFSMHLLLWNPSTRESMVLPLPELPLNDCIYGLGYDAASDDYKILKIGMTGESYGVSNEIFTLRTGSWRKLGKSPAGVHCPPSCIPPACMDSLAFVNGAFHWLGYSFDCSVVSLSISNEAYGQISLYPLLKRLCRIFNMIFARHDISVFEGMLCFYSTNEDRQGGCTFKLWVMKEYGNTESWIELLTVRDTGLYTAIPKYRFADGEMLLYCRPFTRNDTVFKTSKGLVGLCPQVVDTFQEGFAYTESLISPKLLT